MVGWRGLRRDVPISIFPRDPRWTRKRWKPWDLSEAKTRAKVESFICDGKPYFLLLSPMCTVFPAIQAIDRERRRAKLIRKELEVALGNITWHVRLYKIKLLVDQILPIRAPTGATPWKLG